MFMPDSKQQQQQLADTAGSLDLVLQSAPLIAGVGVAAAALLSRELVKQYVKFKAAPAAARAFYKVSSCTCMVGCCRPRRFAMLIHYAATPNATLR